MHASNEDGGLGSVTRYACTCVRCFCNAVPTGATRSALPAPCTRQYVKQKAMYRAPREPAHSMQDPLSLDHSISQSLDGICAASPESITGKQPCHCRYLRPSMSMNYPGTPADTQHTHVTPTRDASLQGFHQGGIWRKIVPDHSS